MKLIKYCNFIAASLYFANQAQAVEFPKLKLNYGGIDVMSILENFGLNSAAKCAACTGVVKKLSAEVLKPTLDEKIINISTKVCKLFAMDAQNVCPDLVPIMATPIIDMLGREMLSKERVCNEWLGFCEIPKY